MEMHQIRYFLAVCEEANFTRAARRVGVAQPSLTKAISVLERDLGGLLFQRKPFVVMTALAYAIQPYMQRITEAADQALQAAETFRAKKGGEQYSAAINQQAASGELARPL